MKLILKTAAIFFTILICNDINGQESKIKEIKEHYYNLSQLIAECDKDDPENCSIYRNDLIINSNGKEIYNWPACGNYYRKITFWYNAAPAHWDEKGKEALFKIDITEFCAANSYNYEYLFNEGKLIFCFCKQKQIGEYRFYFSDKKLIKFLKKSESDYSEIKEEDYTVYIKEAEKLQDFFVNMFP